MNAWDLVGVDPNMVINFNPTKVDIWLQALTKYLADTGIIDEDRFVIFFKEKMLGELKKVRQEVIEPQIARAKIFTPGNGPVQQ